MFWSKRKPQVQDTVGSGDTENPMYSGTGYKEMDDSLLGTAPSSKTKDKQKKQLAVAAGAFLAALLITWAVLSYAWLPGHVQDAMDDASITAASVTLYEPIVVNSFASYQDDSSGEEDYSNNNNNNKYDDDSSSWRRRMAQRFSGDDSSNDNAGNNDNNENFNTAYYQTSGDDSSAPVQNNNGYDDDSSWGASVGNGNGDNQDYSNVDEKVWAILPMDANIQVTTGQLGKSTIQDLTANVYFCFSQDSTYYKENIGCEYGNSATLLGTVSLSDADILPGGKPTDNYLNPQIYITNAMVFKEFAASLLVDSSVTVQLVGTATVKSRVAGIWSHSVKDVEIDMPMYFQGMGGLANSFSPTLDFTFLGSNYPTPNMVMSSFMQNPSSTSIAEMGTIRMEMWGPDGFASNTADIAFGYVGATFSDVVLLGNSSLGSETFEVTETIYNDNSDSWGTYQTIEVTYENVTQNSYTNGWNNFASAGPVTIKTREGESNNEYTESNVIASYGSLDFLVSNYLNGEKTNMMGQIKSGTGASASTSDVWSYVLSGAKIPYAVTPAAKTPLITLINCENLENAIENQGPDGDDKEAEARCMLTLKNPFGVSLTGIEMELTVYFAGVPVATIEAHDEELILPKYGYNIMEASLEVIESPGEEYSGTMYNTWVTSVGMVGGTTSQLVGEIYVGNMATVDGLWIKYGPQAVTITDYQSE